MSVIPLTMNGTGEPSTARHDPYPSDTLTAVRSSCDRCRTHRLKCRVEEGTSVSCERCSRAKVPCVFSRRRRANKSSSAKARHNSQSNATNTTAHAGPSESLPSSTALGIAEEDTMWQTYFQSTSSFGVPGIDPFFWDGLTLGSLTTSQSSIGSPSDGSALDKANYSLNSQDGSCMDSSSLNNAFWPPMSPISATLQYPDITGPTLQDGLKSANRELRPEERLLALTNDIQQQIKTLEAGQWHEDEASLRDYPIGTVAHLAQEFGEVATLVLDQACAIETVQKWMATSSHERVDERPMSGPAGMASHRRGSTNLSPLDVRSTGETADTATLLHVLGGYMSLLLLYDTVFGHFRTHLMSLISSGDSSPTGLASHGSNYLTIRAMQLGDFPSVGDLSGLGRVHTAVNVLLASLETVDKQLGPKAAIARDLVISRLTQDFALSNSNKLFNKVRLVKELLRGKMGL